MQHMMHGKVASGLQNKHWEAAVCALLAALLRLHRGCPAEPGKLHDLSWSGHLCN